MTVKEKLVLNMPLTTLITILALTAGVVTTHFKGVADSKDYTDKKTEILQKDINEIKKDQRDMAVKLENMDANTKIMKDILVKRFGSPPNGNRLED